MEPTMSDNIYSFEKQGRRKFLNQGSEDAAVTEFAKRLRFVDSNYEEHRDTLLNFVLNHHKLISRYRELRAREMRWRVLFTVVSLVLLLAIPLLIFAIGVWLGDKGSVTAQVTTVLTGLLAVHRSLSSWLDKRKVIGNFWKAESDLKTKLYTCEDKWRGQATHVVTENGRTINKLKDDFLKEARAAITEARVIVQDEQSKFFDAVTYPSIDLGEMLKDAGDRAKALASAHASPELEQRNKQRQAIEALEGKLAEQKDKIVRLEIEIEQRRLLVEKKRQEMQTASKEDADALKLEITTHQIKMRQAEDELVIAKGQLEALQRSRSV